MSRATEYVLHRGPLDAQVARLLAAARGLRRVSEALERHADQAERSARASATKG